jgi:NAD(P)H-hydrate epimerase
MDTETNKIIQSLLRPRNPDSHKGDYGHALIVAGNKGKMGAATIAAKACLRAGAGLLTVNVPERERAILQIAVPEAMLIMRENTADFAIFSAACIGPGIGTDKEAQEMVEVFLDRFTRPLLLDADALNIVTANNKLFDKISAGTVLTPHSVEFDRLFGIHDTPDSRISTAIAMAEKNQWVIVLKGHRTLVTHCGEVFVNNTGNAGLAKGGSGDALSGIICALLAQGYKPFDAARIGVYIHGLAADIALNKQSMESMLITDVIDCLGSAFKKLIGKL